MIVKKLNAVSLLALSSLLLGCDPNVEKITDQMELAEIAINGDKSVIRSAAMDKITDREALLYVALETNSKSSIAATKKLNDQAALQEIAFNASHFIQREVAVERLTDQDTLAKIALEDPESWVQAAAVERLTDQALLAKVAEAGNSNKVRISAIKKITVQEVLKKLAANDPQAAIRKLVVTQGVEQEFLVERLKFEPSAAVRVSIINTLDGQEMLHRAALTAYHQDDREFAWRKLRKVSPRLGNDVASAHDAIKQKAISLEQETDNTELLDNILQGEFDILRIAAAQRLEDMPTLKQAAMHADDYEVLKILLLKLNDKTTLYDIANNAKHPGMRLAARRKGEGESWQDIFGSVADDAIADVVSAVALFDELQPEAKEAAQQASLRMIRRGDESRIPELVHILNMYGDELLAEDYLNCGQPDLGNAGRGWARERGLSIKSGDGSSRAKWGRQH